MKIKIIGRLSATQGPQSTLAFSILLSLFKNSKTSGLDLQDPGLVSRAACLVWAFGDRTDVPLSLPIADNVRGVVID